MNPQAILASWQRSEVLLLLVFAQLTLLTLVGLLVAHRLGHRRVQVVQAPPTMTSTRLTGDEDPHPAFRRLAAGVTSRAVGDLTPLRGSADPAYLLFREDDTRRRLLLVGGKNPKASLKVLHVRRRRCPTYALNSMHKAEIAAVWMALAPRLNLPAWPPASRRWWLVELPPEELS
jgi:hypothetical protein